ncbi:MAG: large conductance mechanosensitive channel protein MscL [Microthrixaceae bacterium]
MLDGFKKFIMQGNVVDMAVGIVIGAVFGDVVKSFTNDVLMAIIGAIVGKPNFNALSFGLGDGVVHYGNFLTTLVNFLIVAAAVYFFVVVPINHLKDRRKGDTTEDPTNEERVVSLLEEIAANSRR